MTNFDPFYDWQKITDDHAEDLSAMLTTHRNLVDKLIDNPDCEAAREFFQINDQLKNYYEETMDEIFTVPVMVHSAAPKKVEAHPDQEDIEITVQRCERCASPLQMWHEGMVGMGPEGLLKVDEDDIDWWDVGAIIAKATSPTGIGMYEVDPARKLEDHERECVGLPNME